MIENKKETSRPLALDPWNAALAFSRLGIGSAKDMFPGANFEKIFPSPPPIDFDKLIPKEFMRSAIKRKA